MLWVSNHSLLLSVSAEPRNSFGSIQHGAFRCLVPHFFGGRGGGPGGTGHGANRGCWSSLHLYHVQHDMLCLLLLDSTTHVTRAPSVQAVHVE